MNNQHSENIKRWSGCCCKCKNHFEDFYHCITNPSLKSALTEKNQKPTCVCNIHKGWICALPEGRHHSNWPLHGFCEMFMEKDDAKEVR